jgi:hypothetical protein
MPIKVVTPSSAVSNVIREHLTRISTLGRFRTRRLSAAAPASLALAVPHRMYNLGLSDIKGAKSTAKAKPTAWRYLVLEGTTVIAAAEAIQKSASAKPQFSNTNEGAFVDSTARAIEAAEQLPEVKTGQFELAGLRVPALFVIALWLKGVGAKSPGDIFIPLEPAPQGVTAGERLSAADFNALLVRLKKERGTTSSKSS